jgi:DivIVA domain-containing protein
MEQHTLFKRASRNKYGYKVEQVEGFIELTRRQYADAKLNLVTAIQVRQNEFDLAKGGYDIADVDAGVDRLEDVFSKRELARQRIQLGDHMMTERKARFVETLRGRLELKNRHRFTHRTWLLRGYSRNEVDAFCALVAKHLETGESMSVQDVRNTVFRAKRGGYAENEVDAFIDRVVDVLQLERALA